MVLKEVLGKVINGINKYKPYIDLVIDPVLVIGATNAGMLYGLFKIGDSDLNNPAKGLALIGSSALGIYLNKKVVWPFARYLRNKDLRDAEENRSARIGSWIKTVLLVTSLYTTTPYIVNNLQEAIVGSVREGIVYHNIDVRGVKLAKKESLEGRIQRTERWGYLTDKYERMYGVPPFTLYAMIMQESYGDPVCINEGDGGAGLIHTQPATAQNLGLKVYKDCDELRSRKHAEELKRLMKRVNYNLDSLVKYDDRFNPEKLISKIAEKMYNYYKKFGNWGAAIAAIHTGERGVYKKGNKGKFTCTAKNYLKSIAYWKSKREEEKTIKKATEDFNKRNREKNLTFDKYVRWFNNNGNNGQKKGK